MVTGILNSKQQENRFERKDKFLKLVSSSDLSLCSDPQGLPYVGMEKVSAQPTEDHGSCNSLSETGEDDEVEESSRGIHTLLLKNESDIECEKEITDACSCYESQCSGNENENKTTRPPLRLRLCLAKEDGEYSPQTKSNHGQLPLVEGDSQGKNDTSTNDTGTFGGKEAGSFKVRDSSVESGRSISIRSHARYSFRPRPEPRRTWHQLGNMPKSIKKMSPIRRRGRQKKEIEERNTEEKVGEESEQLFGCARIDFVYSRNKQGSERPQLLPPPEFPSQSLRILVSGSDRTRSQRQETQLFIWLSGIHGRGLFTKCRISEGRVILEFVGEIVRKQVADLREKIYEEKGLESCYMFRVDRELVIDSTWRGWMGRFINHCCHPNSKAMCVKGRIFIAAVSEIKEGEEITIDYGRDDGDVVGRRCYCGAQNCRGTVAV